jgi:hypothetical protein
LAGRVLALAVTLTRRVLESRIESYNVRPRRNDYCVAQR